MNGAEGPEVQSAFELSRRIRSSVLLFTTVGALIGVVLWIHKVPVTDADLATLPFDAQVATLLIDSSGEHVDHFMSTKWRQFHSSWRSIAQAYNTTDVKSERIDLLLDFLNEPGDGSFEAGGKQRHRRLLVDHHPDIIHVLQQDIERQKDRWQTFEIPIINIRVARAEVATYLALVFAFVHMVSVLKYIYLREMRYRFSTLRVLPDPSLLTATPQDLDHFSRHFRMLCGLIQMAFFFLVPLTVLTMLWAYFALDLKGDFRGETRFFVATLIVSAEFIAILALLAARSSRVRTDLILLWDGRNNAQERSPSARESSAGDSPK